MVFFVCNSGTTVHALNQVIINKELNEFIKNGEDTDIIKLSS